MSATNDEPAFPVSHEDGAGGFQQYSGMTLRDYFAGQAPSELVQPMNRTAGAEYIGRPFPEDGTLSEQSAWSMAIEAKARYEYADAMLAARKQRGRKP